MCVGQIKAKQTNKQREKQKAVIKRPPPPPLQVAEEHVLLAPCFVSIWQSSEMNLLSLPFCPWDHGLMKWKLEDSLGESIVMDGVLLR